MGCEKLWIAVEKGTLRQGAQAGRTRRRNQRTNSQACHHSAHESFTRHKTVDKFHKPHPAFGKILKGQTNPIRR
jgi:hypothetical protein